jgi:hypothetical protein
VANLGLPGLAGGDLVRAAYLAPITGMTRVAFASVADRLIDTVTVLALVVIALPIAGMPDCREPVGAQMWFARPTMTLPLLPHPCPTAAGRLGSLP